METSEKKIELNKKVNEEKHRVNEDDGIEGKGLSLKTTTTNNNNLDVIMPGTFNSNDIKIDETKPTTVLQFVTLGGIKNIRLKKKFNLNMTINDIISFIEYKIINYDKNSKQQVCMYVRVYLSVFLSICLSVCISFSLCACFQNSFIFF